MDRIRCKQCGKIMSIKNGKWQTYLSKPFIERGSWEHQNGNEPCIHLDFCCGMPAFDKRQLDLPVIDIVTGKFNRSYLKMIPKEMRIF